MVEFNRVVDGLLRYINKNVYPNLNDFQEVIARIAVARIAGNPETLKQNIIGNPLFRTFAIVDSAGNVDLESLAKELKREIERKGKVTIEIPMFGKMTFVPTDVDEIYKEITGEIL